MESETDSMLWFINWKQINIRTILLTNLVFIFAYFVVLKSRRKWNTPPGPRSRWPVLGHLPTLDRISPYRTLTELVKVYGPIVSLQFGSFPVVVLNNSDVVQQAFVKQGHEFDDRPKMVTTEISKGKGKHGLVSCYSSESQRSRRRFVMAALRTLGMGKFHLEDQILTEIKCLIEEFSSFKSKPFCPFLLLESTFSNILCCMAFGKRYDYKEQKFQRLLYLLKRILEIASYAGAVTFLPFLRYVPFSGTRKLFNFPDYRQFFEDMVAENEKDYIPGQPRNFIDMYLDHQKIISSSNVEWTEAFGHNDLVRCLCDMFAAGTDTSATTMKWALLHMLKNPIVQSRVHEEIDKVIGEDRMISSKDRRNLPYTDATLMEIQRISSVVPLGVPRATTVNSRLCGYDIPKGTVVISNIWGIHHDPTMWDKPDEFRPERFIDDQGCLRRRDEFIPFSVGRRECLGKQLAQTELFLTFSNIMHRFKLVLPDEAGTLNMEGIMGGTLTPHNFELCALPREL